MKKLLTGSYIGYRPKILYRPRWRVKEVHVGFYGWQSEGKVYILQKGVEGKRMT